MKELVTSCKIGIISIWIVVFLVACCKSAPSSVTPKYTHDTNVALKKKRSADLMDILSNMLLDHSAGVDCEWPNYGNIFDNDYPMDDWMTKEIPQVDYDKQFIDYSDRYGKIGFRENVDLNPPDSFDYSCSEEENNDVVPFVESGYQYNKRPVNSNWSPDDSDFVVIKPGVQDTYRYGHENDLKYKTNGDWNRMPSSGNVEIEEMLWKQFGKTQFNNGFAPTTAKSTPPVRNDFGKEAKFNIFTCLAGPHQPEQETKNIADEYLVLLIKKDHILSSKNGDNATGNRKHQSKQGTSTTTIATPSKAEEESATTEKTTTTVGISTTLGSVNSDVTEETVDEGDCNMTITTETSSLSATHNTFTTKYPSSSTANTMTVVATESPSIITVHVPNSTTATERPSTTTNPVRTSTIVVATTTGRPYRTKSYIPSSVITSRATEGPPTGRPSTTTASTTKTTKGPPTFTISDPRVSYTLSTAETTESPPTFTISDPKVPSTTAAISIETTKSPTKFTIPDPKRYVNRRPTTTAARTTSIPATTTNHIQSNTGASSAFTHQSPSKTTTSGSTTIVSATSESPKTYTRHTTASTTTSTTTTEIPYSTAKQIPTKTTDPAPVVVGDSKYIATDGATTEFSKPTAGTSSTEKKSITTVATIISTTSNINAETTLPPTTIPQTATEMPFLTTTQIAYDSTKTKGIAENGQNNSTVPFADIKTDPQTTNNLEDINEEPSTPPTITSTEESWTYVE